MITGQPDISERTLGHIVSQDYRKSKVLTRLGVDYSCGGNRTLSQVFTGKEDDMQRVVTEWAEVDKQMPQKGTDYLGWDMAFLTNYIIQLHHHFVSSQTKFMTGLAHKVATSNYARHPQIKEVAQLFEETSNRLQFKGQQEENELFPYIINLHKAISNGTGVRYAAFGPVAGPLAAIKAEGGQIVAALAEIRRMTDNYVAPPYTTSTCPILYKMLASYEEDALLHLHLENNILFPRVIQAEESLRANYQLT